MDFDEENVDRTVLALLHLTFICDPVNKAKSVVLTDEGLAESKRLFEELFGRK